MSPNTPPSPETKRNFPSIFKAVQTIWKRERSITEVIIHISNALALMIVGHLLFTYVTFEKMEVVFSSVNSEILYYILGGFIAQMIDGALGMAYGVTATTFLLSVGISPAAASASVHASEVFTSGVSGYMHLKFGNVNSKLFKTLVIPGIIGAILGAYVISSLEEYAGFIKPIVSIYTLFLGAIIIRKALIKRQEKRQLKKVGLLALFGGYLDSIGGGGWGPIVSSTLIASGRHPKYTIGSVNLTEFFVSLASSLTFFTVIGLGYWQVIIGLILGGVVAAPIAARLANKLPIKSMMILVGLVIIIVSLRQIILGADKFF
ncbi:sulfite exporter TauE/SafE family protein [Aquirufa aurantiipilula]|uniref:Probable membrane transporter protein n=1 Tax=Aquirufa aurantiipilula TaxID=2696561 RepID=A0ABT6BMA1_9BACT|nr:sulfite exporter TauE/SafE family protein [Aquirufa aurantiipilula]MBZ1325871.1 sulfite exporter TauE/SafE family protein [Aquirufa aurantiipilula]MDF5691473.1 sulfite exporter TauE/SafE family protein [Aquirufa aurantiipilula]